MIMKVGKWQKSGVRVTLHSVSIIAVLKIHLKHPLKLHRRSLSWVKWFFASWGDAVKKKNCKGLKNNIMGCILNLGM